MPKTPQLHNKSGKMNALHVACDHSCGTWTDQDHKMLELLLPHTKTCINEGFYQHEVVNNIRNST